MHDYDFISKFIILIIILTRMQAEIQTVYDLLKSIKTLVWNEVSYQSEQEDLELLLLENAFQVDYMDVCYIFVYEGKGKVRLSVRFDTDETTSFLAIFAVKQLAIRLREEEKVLQKHVLTNPRVSIKVGNLIYKLDTI